MGFSRKIVLLSLIFISVGLFVSLSSDTQESDGDISYETKRLSVMGWLEEPIPSEKGVLDTLQANTTIFADYFQNAYGSVNLYIGFYDSLERAKLSHAPQVCFTAQGWVMEKNDKINIMLGNQAKTVNRLVLDKDESKLLVYYWYQAGPKIYDDLFQMKLSLLWDKIVTRGGGDGGNAFIRISVPVSSKGQEYSADILQKYANDLYGELPSLFDGTL